MRLFVSVDCDGLETAIAGVQNSLRDLPGLRLVDPGQVHVTMKFLGSGPEFDDEETNGGDGHDLDALVRAIRNAVSEADVDPFDAHVRGIGVFPSLDYISVVWLGVDEGSEPLIALHDALEARTVDLGYAPEDHDFTPHITIARMDHAAAKSDVQRHVREADPDVGTLRIDELRLKESTLTADGPVYDTIERVLL